jgi:hypothetical protein
VTEEQLTTFRDRLAKVRQPVDRKPWADHVHPRGWNDALDFVERALRETLGEPEPKREDAA